MPIKKEAGTPPPMIGKIGPYTVFVTPPSTPKPSSEPVVPLGVESPMKNLPPIKTRFHSPPNSPHLPPQEQVESSPPPPVQAPPVHYKNSDPGSGHGSSFGFFWNAVAKVQNAHSSLDDYVAHWFGLNQSKYQWALDDYYESKGADQDAKPKDIAAKTQMVLIFLRVSVWIRISSQSKRPVSFSCPRDTSKCAEVTIDKVLDEIEKPISSQQLENCDTELCTSVRFWWFGAVYRGSFSCGVLLAVKVLNGSSDKRIEDQFLAEVRTIGHTHHINLVQLYGFCFDKDWRAIVYEYMENGSLERILFNRGEIIEWEKLHNIAIGTAKGIAYLHEECQQRIIHYDIKPENILLDVGFCPKVADFGLAKFCNREKTHMTSRGERDSRVCSSTRVMDTVSCDLEM